MNTIPSGQVCILGSYAKALVVTADRIPRAGETLIGWDYRQTFGGKGSDMAVQAARLGAMVSYLGVVGEDDFGREFADLMETEGVEISGLRFTREQPTGVGLIIKDTSARNIIVVDKGANNLFVESDIDEHLDTVSRADVVLAQLEIPLSTVLHGLRSAKQAGAATVLNPAPAVDLRGVDLGDVDILTPNETEARVSLGLAPDAEASVADLGNALLRLGCRAVVITRGEHGADVITSAGVEHIDPVSVDVVDSNGAGDSFNAALAVALGEQRSLAEAARFAGVVAGLCCQGWETVPSYMHRAAVDDFIASEKE